VSRIAALWLALPLACSHPGTGAGGDGGASDSGLADGGPASSDAGDVVDGGGCGFPFSDAGVLFAGSLDDPRRLALTDNSVFIVASGSLFNADGSVIEVPLAGGSPQVAIGQRTAPDAIAADGVAVYFVDSSGVWQLGMDGGALFVDGTLNNAVFGSTDLALSNDHLVYATGLRWLVGIPRDGGAGVLLYQGDAGALVPATRIEGATAYFLVSNVAEGGLYEVPAAGTGPASRVSAAPVGGTSLTLTPEAFVWTQGSGGDGGVFWLPRDGGTPVTLASGLLGPRRPLVVGSSVLFTDATVGSASNAFLQRASLCAPGTSFPVGPAGNGPGDLGLASGSIFYTSSGSGIQGLVGQLP
jgi:hypothetical protein